MEKDAILMVAISYDGRDSRPHRKFKVENLTATNTKPRCIRRHHRSRLIKILVRQHWFMLFREYVDTGSKMNICCGRLEGFDRCCCEGWTHDKRRVDDFREAESNDLGSSN
ncbi:hypothetical protein CPB85DRAFT_185002 [Mucidula mucida]|nr:hypothetical protein CPB85DRAFT_185002 [Mucidula mucida]